MNLQIGKLLRKNQAYRRLFLGDDGQLKPDAKTVLEDLAKFAALASGPTIVSPISRQVDPLATHQRIGRGEAVLRIWKMIDLPINDIYAMREDRDND